MGKAPLPVRDWVVYIKVFQDDVVNVSFEKLKFGVNE